MTGNTFATWTRRACKEQLDRSIAIAEQRGAARAPQQTSWPLRLGASGRGVLHAVPE